MENCADSYLVICPGLTVEPTSMAAAAFGPEACHAKGGRVTKPSDQVTKIQHFRKKFSKMIKVSYNHIVKLDHLYHSPKGQNLSLLATMEPASILCSIHLDCKRGPL